jgi:hypothetical protein
LEKKKRLENPPQKKSAGTAFCAGPLALKKKVGVEQEKFAQVIWANAWFGPFDPFANETSQRSRPCALPFAHWFLLGLFLTRASQVRMWVPFN